VAARTGSGIHPAMVLAHARASVLSMSPGNRRRNSITADSSPSSLKMVRIAAASASVTTNIPEPWLGTPRLASAMFRHLAVFPGHNLPLGWHQLYRPVRRRATLEGAGPAGAVPHLRKAVGPRASGFAQRGSSPTRSNAILASA
jgi:hypothetical protein